MKENIYKEFKPLEEYGACTEEEHLGLCSQKVNDIYNKLKSRILDLGDIDIKVKHVYIAFKGSRNIVDLLFYKEKIELFINMKKGKLSDPIGITRDISKIYSIGNGDYSVDVRTEEDIDKVMPLIEQSFKVNKKHI